MAGGVRAAAERAAHLGGGILARLPGGVSAMHLDGLAAGLSEGLHGLQEGLQSKVPPGGRGGGWVGCVHMGGAAGRCTLHSRRRRAL